MVRRMLVLAHDEQDVQAAVDGVGEEAALFFVTTKTLAIRAGVAIAWSVNTADMLMLMLGKYHSANRCLSKIVC
jgi:hypothetical protein